MIMTNTIPITLQKGSDGLGLKVAGSIGVTSGSDKLGVFVKHLIPGGTAEQNGIINVNDQIIEIDGQSLVGITQEEVMAALQNTSQTVNLIISRKLDNETPPTSEDSGLSSSNSVAIGQFEEEEEEEGNEEVEQSQHDDVNEERETSGQEEEDEQDGVSEQDIVVEEGRTGESASVEEQTDENEPNGSAVIEMEIVGASVEQFLSELQKLTATVICPDEFHKLWIQANNSAIEYFVKNFEHFYPEPSEIYQEQLRLLNSKLLTEGLKKKASFDSEMNVIEQQWKTKIESAIEMYKGLVVKALPTHDLNNLHITAADRAKNFLLNCGDGTDTETLKKKMCSQLKEALLPLKETYVQINTARQVPFFPPKHVKAIKFGEDGNDGFLGKGGYGSVRLGYHGVLGVVAVKCISITGATADMRQVQEKFSREIQLFQKASHVNVVRIEGYTSWSAAMGIVMEYMPCGSLNSLLFGKDNDMYRVEHIHPAVRLQFCYDVTHGLTYLHHGFNDQRLTHGDLKPDNILLTSNLRCKIADFGGADFASCSQFVTENPSEKHLEYTKIYAAPERLKKQKQRLTKAMDVYSVGMIFHGILIRNYPIQPRQTQDSYLSDVLRGEHPDLTEVENLKRKHPDSESIIEHIKLEMQRSWVYNENDRPQMKEIRDKLHDVYASIGVPTINGHVADVTKNMKITIPPTSVDCLVPIDQLASPHFNL